MAMDHELEGDPTSEPAAATSGIHHRIINDWASSLPQPQPPTTSLIVFCSRVKRHRLQGKAICARLLLSSLPFAEDSPLIDNESTHTLPQVADSRPNSITGLLLKVH
jgi:hypothetical protein